MSPLLLLVVAVPDSICGVVFEHAQDKPETEVEAVQHEQTQSSNQINQARLSSIQLECYFAFNQSSHGSLVSFISGKVLDDRLLRVLWNFESTVHPVVTTKNKSLLWSTD